MYRQRVLASAFLCLLIVLSGTQALAQAPPDKDTGRGFLGILVGPARNTEQGILVRDVIPGSPADKAGLKNGDILVMVGEQKMKDAESFVQIVSAKKPGDKVELKVLRDGKEQTLMATLGDTPTRGPGPGGPGGPPQPGDRVRELERHIQALEKRLDELEKKVNKQPDKQPDK